MPLIFALLLSNFPPERNLTPRQSVAFSAEYRDHSGPAEIKTTYDLTFRVLGKPNDKAEWPCRFSYANQATATESGRFARAGSFGNLDVSLGKRGLAGPVSLRAEDAATSLPRLAFFLPEECEANGDFTARSGQDDPATWSATGKLTTSSVRKEFRLVGDLKAVAGDARLHFEIVFDGDGIPTVANLARRGGGQDADFVLRRR
jgi:hypothetical protein